MSEEVVEPTGETIAHHGQAGEIVLSYIIPL